MMAAPSSAKSWRTRTQPRTRARLPPCRRNIRCPNLRSTFGLVERYFPVTRWLAGGRVVIIAFEDRAQLRRQSFIRHAQQTSDRRANHRHRILRGHRIVQRRRVEHALTADEPGFFGYLERRLEDAIGPRTVAQPSSHVDQHRVHEARVVEVEAARRVLPS